MKSSEILLQLQDIFRDVLDNDEIELNNESSQKDIDEWDSLTHIQLVVAIEKKYKIRFASVQIQSWNNVGELIESLIEKLSIQ